MVKNKNITQKMMDFIDASPTAFHVVDNIRKDLVKRDFVELKESEEWSVEIPHDNRGGAARLIPAYHLVAASCGG